MNLDTCYIWTIFTHPGWVVAQIVWGGDWGLVGDTGQLQWRRWESSKDRSLGDYAEKRHCLARVTGQVGEPGTERGCLAVSFQMGHLRLLSFRLFFQPLMPSQSFTLFLDCPFP